MTTVPYRFMLTAIVFVILGMLLGIWMGTNENFTFAPVHAHLNLVGWVTMFLFGLWYRGVPAIASSTIASVHYWVAVVGAVLLAIGIYGSVAPNPSLALVVIPGALLTLLSMLIFLWVVWRASQSRA
jgi:hypothetical protein